MLELWIIGHYRMISKGKEEPKVELICDHTIICCGISPSHNCVVWDEDYVIFVLINERPCTIRMRKGGNAIIFFMFCFLENFNVFLVIMVRVL